VRSVRWASERPMKEGLGFYGLSTASFNLPTAQAIASRNRRLIPHPYFCSTDAASLRAIQGVDSVTMDDEHTPGHVRIAFKGRPSRATLQAVCAVFGAPVTNMTPVPKGGA
jgi:hypothetical protein